MERLSEREERGTESKAERRLRKDAQRSEEFYEVWRMASAGAINREMALQVHLLAQTTAEKYAALRKVYIGIMILLALTAVFLTILGIHVFAPGIV